MAVADVAHADPLAPAGLPPVPGGAPAVLAQGAGGDAEHGVVPFRPAAGFLLLEHGSSHFVKSSPSREHRQSGHSARTHWRPISHSATNTPSLSPSHCPRSSYRTM